ncbi:MAG: hypothetical protein LBH47_02730 [Christensenellaceae bacterium]|jgi:hypothetical protein|nr:hypothetical protein [Christensenellaceae bacterium]
MENDDVKQVYDTSVNEAPTGQPTKNYSKGIFCVALLGLLLWIAISLTTLANKKDDDYRWAILTVTDDHIMVQTGDGIDSPPFTSKSVNMYLNYFERQGLHIVAIVTLTSNPKKIEIYLEG